jgi:fibro-slime domain-containing protein
MIKWATLGLLISAIGCSASDGGEFGAQGSGAASGAGSGSATAGSASSGSGGSSGTFVAAAASGSGTGSGGGSNCGNVLLVTFRDFTEAHPDFESFGGGQLDGIVSDTLGADGKPFYPHAGGTAQTTGPVEFSQWYNDAPGINMTVTEQIQFMETSPGVFLYDNSAFFLLDGKGFGNGPGFFPPHNFLFTTEIHSTFTYHGGEVFTFRGDDDLWVFINGKLAIDLGGLHSAMEETANIDALAPTLGITVGGSYPLDVFHAERHTDESNFRIETTISCFTPLPPPS